MNASAAKVNLATQLRQVKADGSHKESGFFSLQPMKSRLRGVLHWYNPNCMKRDLSYYQVETVLNSNERVKTLDATLLGVIKAEKGELKKYATTTADIVNVTNVLSLLDAENEEAFTLFLRNYGSLMTALKREGLAFDAELVANQLKHAKVSSKAANPWDDIESFILVALELTKVLGTGNKARIMDDVSWEMMFAVLGNMMNLSSYQGELVLNSNGSAKTSDATLLNVINAEKDELKKYVNTGADVVNVANVLSLLDAKNEKAFVQFLRNYGSLMDALNRKDLVFDAELVASQLKQAKVFSDVANPWDDIEPQILVALKSTKTLGAGNKEQIMDDVSWEVIFFVLDKMMSYTAIGGTTMATVYGLIPLMIGSSVTCAIMPGVMKCYNEGKFDMATFYAGLQDVNNDPSQFSWYTQGSLYGALITAAFAVTGFVLKASRAYTYCCIYLMVHLFINMERQVNTNAIKEAKDRHYSVAEMAKYAMLGLLRGCVKDILMIQADAPINALKAYLDALPAESLAKVWSAALVEYFGVLIDIIVTVYSANVKFNADQASNRLYNVLYA